MISDPIELAELVATTFDLIELDGFDISLIRNEWTRVPGGGVKRVDNPEPKDPVRRYFSGVAADAVRVFYSEGEQIVAAYVLIGPPGDDVQEKDEFVLNNQKFRIVEVHPDRSYETRAWITSRT